MSKVRFYTFFVFIIIALMSACTKQSTHLNEPVAVLREYISRSFSVKSPEDQAQLAQLLTGDAKERLLAMTPEQFKTSLVDQKRELLKLVIKDVRYMSENSQANVEYEISFIDPLKGNSAKVTSRKLCQFVKADAQSPAGWLISQVQNIQEVVQFKNELSLPQ